MTKIRLKSNFIKLDIVDENDEVVEEVRFYKTDENINKFWNEYKNKSPIDANKIEEEGIEKAKEYLKETMDNLLEVGTFDKLYKHNPSILVMAAYFIEFVIAIRDELENESRPDVVDKYLKKAK